MKRVLLATTLVLLLWGAPALAGPPTDTDGDGVYDFQDNCRTASNAAQDDTDGDLCGNRCDADYNQNGVVNFIDFSAFSFAFASNDMQKDHTQPVAGPVGFLDFSYFSSAFGGAPGPSGTTTGTTACP
jgi:Thrombospondin type 3 repeat